ncbi:hypothetical protein [Mucilaginibacter sp.]|uniref:hypothetical protein n=1 Tax=Mucilaginibacter sp. TaxID=1882438 RepID=UPI00260B8442|nr:hypothetical protein [Mucilaginibacter sp.]MDB5130185.1 hypothetical protein [Mucilaginibacter sp.]
MKTYILHLLGASLAIIALSGCTNDSKKVTLREFEFNDSGLKVITSYVNEKAGTMSILYGNEAALNYSIKGNGEHVTGEVFKQVTFKQQAHEFWYGSRINGALQQVETINTVLQGANVIPVYAIQHYGPNTAKAEDRSARIKFILSQQASVFP